MSEDSQSIGFDKYFEICATEKSARWLRDIPETGLLPDGQGEGVLKIYSLLVFQEVGQLMNAILHTMARLKHKVRHENFLFGLKILFSFCRGEGGEGLGL